MNTSAEQNKWNDGLSYCLYLQCHYYIQVYPLYVVVYSLQSCIVCTHVNEVIQSHLFVLGPKGGC